MSARARQPYLVTLFATALSTVALMIVLPRPQVFSGTSNGSEQERASQLLQSRNSSFFPLDIARMNLLCAESLPGSAGDGLNDQLSILDEWAKRIASETTRHWYRYLQNPKEFNYSEGFFRMLMMAIVLSEDFNIQYDPALRASPAAESSKDGFFGSADSVFLCGLLDSTRRGTCSSLPVLYVALGRPLGYPLYVVTTKGHLFVRWDGQGQRFNVEVTGHGLNTFGDDYYRRWPFPITVEEESAEGYLKNLDAGR